MKAFFIDLFSIYRECETIGDIFLLSMLIIVILVSVPLWLPLYFLHWLFTYPFFKKGDSSDE